MLSEICRAFENFPGALFVPLAGLFLGHAVMVSVALVRLYMSYAATAFGKL